MNQSPMDIEEERIIALWAKVYEWLDLDWVTVRLKFDDRFDYDGQIVAETVSDWEYRQHTIVWHMSKSISQTDDEMLETMIHEAIHILTSPLWWSLPEKFRTSHEKYNEFSTENVARAIRATMSTPWVP